ncbi:MAG: hypothetical protein EON61_13385 [Alphaproteobacteria bacterium]|nr:MAG: hypothetical protein EON61_13385 [Alphaproteobacteria bacterium]
MHVTQCHYNFLIYCRLAADVGTELKLHITPSHTPSHTPSRMYRGTWHCLTSTYAHHGVRGVYRGVWISVVGALVYRALHIGGYDSLKESYKCDDLYIRFAMAQVSIHRIISYTIHHIPYTIYHTPYTIYHIPYTIYHIPYTIHHIPYTIYHIPYTIHHIPYTIYHTPYTIHHTPYTIHHSPYTSLDRELGVRNTHLSFGYLKTPHDVFA